MSLKITIVASRDEVRDVVRDTLGSYQILNRIPILRKALLTVSIQLSCKGRQTMVIQARVLLRCRGCVKVTIRWQTGARHGAEAPWLNSPESHGTDPAILDIIRRLAPTHSYDEIAEHLNRNGYRSRRGKPFTKTLLDGLRRCWGIVKGETRRPRRSDDRGDDGRYKVAAAASLLGVSYSCVDRLCRVGRVDFIRLAVGGTRWVKLTDENVERLRRGVARRGGRRRGSALNPFQT